ncbi:MAG: serine hydrolase domain-containing protein [Rhodospirillaceae bacterium]
MTTTTKGLSPFLNDQKPDVSGRCDPKFQHVADVFEQNLTQRGADGDVGATCAVMIDGDLVVDLWGGYADVQQGKPWQEDTLCCCWSVSKTIGAVLALRLVDQGRLDLDTPVAAYWPAFGAHGKERILVRHLLDHTAGVSFVDATLKPGAANDWETMIAALEQTAPNWEAGTQLGYLNQTQGYLLGGLCYQVNGGRRLAQFLREELAEPFSLDWHFAIPDEDLSRLATVYQIDASTFTRIIEKNPNSVFAKSMKGRDPAETYNSLRWRKAENGAGTSHTNARAMAKLYGALARGGALDSFKVLSEKMLNTASTESVREICAVNGIEMRFSTGFEMNCPPITPMGTSKSAFGYIGAGGSFAFADPELKLGFGYGHNLMHQGLGPGPCGLPLVEATLACAKT